MFDESGGAERAVDVRPPIVYSGDAGAASDLAETGDGEKDE